MAVCNHGQVLLLSIVIHGFMCRNGPLTSYQYASVMFGFSDVDMLNIVTAALSNIKKINTSFSAGISYAISFSILLNMRWFCGF